MENIGGRKFVAYIISMLGWLAVLYCSVMKGMFTMEAPQMFLLFLVGIQTIFFGGNVLENFINKKAEQKTEVK